MNRLYRVILATFFIKQCHLITSFLPLSKAFKLSKHGSCCYDYKINT